ncbi:hypothetical protein GCM10007092_15290 [Thermus composti]|uniref:DUF5723 domain-containing protein n=1 Tax=Thermus composti TaxID=532059 RepID=A0ABV6Q2M3_9DEIN|nr:hypothetical protein [Thermus composti]GGN02001.1 hypothetical protein GCM10007092_15290 [Thermus composti]
MKKWIVYGLLGLLSLGSLGQAQGVRSLGMGGVTLPGPGSAWANPAYASFPNTFEREGFRVPLGLLRLLPLFPDTSPFLYFADPEAFRQGFDLLSFYDQLTHLDSFLINPARSPDEVVFRVSAGGLSITDGQGRSLVPTFQVGNNPGKPTSLVPSPYIPLTLDLGPGLRLSFGPFLGTQGLWVQPSPELQRALEGDLEACKTTTPSPCALTGQGAFAQGLSLALDFSTPVGEVPGLGKVYVGTRGEGFYGLGYLEAQTSARPVFDGDGNLTGASYQVRYFLSYPEFLESNLGLGGGGQGYGFRVDLGAAVEGESWAFGVGVRNLLGLSEWRGVEVTLEDGEETGRQPATRRGEIFAPEFFMNGAYRLPPEVAPLLLAADLRFGAVAPAGHLGLEYYGLEPTILRAGLGYEGGFRLGVGAGWNLESFSLDLALTTHEAPLVGGPVFGLALAVGF